MRANRLLFVSLFGGPSPQDIGDLKPDAQQQIRCEFERTAKIYPADALRPAEISATVYHFLGIDPRT